MKYDVVIYKKSDRRIESFAGKDMGDASRRIATVLPRLNNSYDVTSVPAGKYREGDMIQDYLDDWTETRKAMDKNHD